MPMGKLVYCNRADVTKFLGNMFRSTRFYTGMVKDGKLEEIPVDELDQGDIIHFRPLIPVVGMRRMPGMLAVVHGVSPEGMVYLGNMNATLPQIKEINKLHVSGKL